MGNNPKNVGVGANHSLLQRLQQLGAALGRDPHLPWLEMDSVLSSPAMNGPARPVASVHRAATIMSQNQVTSRGGTSAMAIVDCRSTLWGHKNVKPADARGTDGTK